MNTPIDAVPVPVAPAVRPDMWAVTYTFKGSDGKDRWAYPLGFGVELAAREFAAGRPGSLIFRIPGSGDTQ